jgi:hypothetical protein
VLSKDQKDCRATYSIQPGMVTAVSHEAVACSHAGTSLEDSGDQPDERDAREP